MPSYLLGHPDDLHHFGDGVHAHDVRAGQDRRRHRGRRAPVALDGGAIVNASRMNDLREAPTSTGRPSAAAISGSLASTP